LISISTSISKRGIGSMVQNKYTDLSDSPEGLFIDECGVENIARQQQLVELLLVQAGYDPC
jgi:hypothetical protein